MVQLNPAKWGKKKKEEEKPKRRGRAPLKERQANQKRIQKKRDEDAAKRREEIANRPRTARQKMSDHRTANREVNKAKKEALKAGKDPKPKSSTKSRALMTKPQRAAADRAARLARYKARKAKK